VFQDHLSKMVDYRFEGVGVWVGVGERGWGLKERLEEGKSKLLDCPIGKHLHILDTIQPLRECRSVVIVSFH
jgi:hypothetical protein